MMQKFLKQILVLVGVVFCVVPGVVGAEATPPAIGIDTSNLVGGENEQLGGEVEEAKLYLQQGFLGEVVNLLTGALSGLAVLIIVIGGFQYLLARGNEEKIRKAHHTVVMAAVGLFLMLFAYSVVSIVVNFTSLAGR